MPLNCARCEWMGEPVPVPATTIVKHVALCDACQDELAAEEVPCDRTGSTDDEAGAA